MYVAVIPNRGSPPAILLRESYREAGKTKNRTLANLSDWPAERIEQLRAVLRGDRLLPATEAVQVVRALPHGHVLAALTTGAANSPITVTAATAGPTARNWSSVCSVPPTAVRWQSRCSRATLLIRRPWRCRSTSSSSASDCSAW